MFISSFEELRQRLLSASTLETLVQLEYNAFEPACVPVCCFTLNNKSVNNFEGSFIKLSDFKGCEMQPIKTIEAIRNHNCGWYFKARASEFCKIPGSPIAYWLGSKIINVFKQGRELSHNIELAVGLFTCNNKKFLGMRLI
jgi:hypothetical protein